MTIAPASSSSIQRARPSGGLEQPVATNNASSLPESLRSALTEHEDLSRETVRRRLAENHLKPWRKDMWCIPQIDVY